MQTSTARAPSADPLLVRLVDWGFGLSALGWGLRMLLAHGASIVGLTLACLNLTAGVLFLLRRAPSRLANLRDNALALASLFASGVALELAPAPSAWPLLPALAFAAAGLGAVASLAALGSSFGVLPAVRALVDRGPYRLVRHPAYLCEMLMVAIAALVSARPAGAAVVGCALALLVVRIRIEEGVLASEDYSGYGARVPWRLLPGVW